MMPKTIRVHPNPSEYTFMNGKKGDVVFIVLHGLEWPAELRAKPPRVRLMEDGKRRPEEGEGTDGESGHRGVPVRGEVAPHDVADRRRPQSGDHPNRGRLSLAGRSGGHPTARASPPPRLSRRRRSSP